MVQVVSIHAPFIENDFHFLFKNFFLSTGMVMLSSWVGQETHVTVRKAARHVEGAVYAGAAAPRKGER